MFGIAYYLIIASTVAVAVFLLGEWMREPGSRAADHPGRVALVAGLLWPVVAIGLAQCALVMLAANRWGGRPAPVTGIRVVERTASP